MMFRVSNIRSTVCKIYVLVAATTNVPSLLYYWEYVIHY